MGLAPILVEEVFRIIGDLKSRGVTMLLVEQFAAAALKVADYGYVMENGRISVHGDAAKLRDDPAVTRRLPGRRTLRSSPRQRTAVVVEEATGIARCQPINHLQQARCRVRRAHHIQPCFGKGRGQVGLHGTRMQGHTQGLGVASAQFNGGGVHQLVQSRLAGAVAVPAAQAVVANAAHLGR